MGFFLHDGSTHDEIIIKKRGKIMVSITEVLILLMKINTVKIYH